MDPVAQQILAVATLVTAVGSIILGLVNRHTLTSQGKTITQVQEQTNGMMEKLGIAREAKGNLQGRTDERTEYPRGREG